MSRAGYFQAITVASAVVLGSASVWAYEGPFWDRHRQDHPKCTSWVNQHESMTQQLEKTAEGLRSRKSSEQKTKIQRRLNALAQQRSQAMAHLQDCIAANYGFNRTFTLDASENQVGLSALSGTTHFGGAPFNVSLAKGHLIGEAIDGPVAGHPTYNHAWGKLTSEYEFTVTRLRDTSGRIGQVNFVVPVVPAQ